MTSYSSTLFQHALLDPSNLEMDWLWLATRVERESEQRYCIAQALRINPRSALAQRSFQHLTATARAQLECIA